MVDATKQANLWYTQKQLADWGRWCQAIVDHSSQNVLPYFQLTSIVASPAGLAQATAVKRFKNSNIIGIQLVRHWSISQRNSGIVGFSNVSPEKI